MDDRHNEWFRFIQEAPRPDQRSRRRRRRMAMVAGIIAISFASTFCAGIGILYATGYFQSPQLNPTTPGANAPSATPASYTKPAGPTALPSSSPSLTQRAVTLAPDPPTPSTPTSVKGGPVNVPTTKTNLPPKPINTPSLTKTQTILVPGNQETGVKFVAPSTGVYRLTVIDGACSSWPSNGPWRTIIHIYKNRQIEWGWRLWQDKRFYEPVNPDYSMGSLQDWPSREQAANVAKNITPIEVSLTSGAYLILDYIDERGAYAGNRGNATVQVSWKK